MFYHVDKQESLNDVLKRKFYDDDLLLLLNQHLATANEKIPEIIFLHLCGSHYPPQFYIPKEWHPYSPGTMCNDYDNTIAFTDSILGEIHKLLLETKRPAFMFYISDHGESPTATHWRDLNNNDVWEIPMILWMSEDYIKCHQSFYEQLKEAIRISPSLQSDELFHGLCSIAGVSWDNFPKEKDFTHSCFQSKKKRLLINQEYKKR